MKKFAVIAAVAAAASLAACTPAAKNETAEAANVVASDINATAADAINSVDAATDNAMAGSTHAAASPSCPVPGKPITNTLGVEAPAGLPTPSRGSSRYSFRDCRHRPNRWYPSWNESSPSRVRQNGKCHLSPPRSSQWMAT